MYIKGSYIKLYELYSHSVIPINGVNLKVMVYYESRKLRSMVMNNEMS